MPLTSGVRRSSLLPRKAILPLYILTCERSREPVPSGLEASTAKRSRGKRLPPPSNVRCPNLYECLSRWRPQIERSTGLLPSWNPRCPMQREACDSHERRALHTVAQTSFPTPYSGCQVRVSQGRGYEEEGKTRGRDVLCGLPHPWHFEERAQARSTRCPHTKTKSIFSQTEPAASSSTSTTSTTNTTNIAKESSYDHTVGPT